MNNGVLSTTFSASLDIFRFAPGLKTRQLKGFGSVRRNFRGCFRGRSESAMAAAVPPRGLPGQWGDLQSTHGPSSQRRLRASRLARVHRACEVRAAHGASRVHACMHALSIRM